MLRQFSSKYPDGTIVMVNGDEPAEEIVTEFVVLRGAYEAETGTSPIKPYIAPDPTLAAAVANAAPLTQPQAQPSTPSPGLNGRLADGQLHPTSKCPVCDAPRKAKDWQTKAGKRAYKLECSVDYNHKPDDWTANYR